MPTTSIPIQANIYVHGIMKLMNPTPFLDLSKISA